MAWQADHHQILGLLYLGFEYCFDRGLQCPSDANRLSAEWNLFWAAAVDHWLCWRKGCDVMTTLTFPNITDFLKYLKQQEIRRLGIVSISKTEPANKGMALYVEKFRLTAIRYYPKFIAEELLILDIPYYRSLFVTEKHNHEEAQKPKKKVLDQIMKHIGEFQKKELNYKFEILNCQFDH